MSNTAKKFFWTAGFVFAGLYAASAACEIRLLTYNVHHCAGADKRVDVPRVAEVIKRENPDFVGLNEIDQCATRSHGIDMPEELGRLTGLHATFALSIPLQGGAYGNVVLSREKPLSVLRVPLPGREPRVLLLCEFADCWFGTAHFALQQTNQLQTAEIIRRVVSEKASAKPVFLTGDWNCQPDSPPLTAMRGFMKILSDEKSRTFHGFKKHSPGTGGCIDYIAVDCGASARVKVKDTHVTPDEMTSDHNPVVVTVEFVKPCTHLH